MDTAMKVIGAFFVFCCAVALVLFAVAPLVRSPEEPEPGKPIVFYVIDSNGKAIPHDGYITPEGRLIPAEPSKPAPPNTINVYPPRRIFPLGSDKGAAEPEAKK